MLNVTYKLLMLSVIMLNVIMLNVIILNVIMLNVIMLNAIMLNVIMLNVIILRVVMLSVVAPIIFPIQNAIWQYTSESKAGLFCFAFIFLLQYKTGQLFAWACCKRRTVIKSGSVMGYYLLLSTIYTSDHAVHDIAIPVDRNLKNRENLIEIA